MAATDVAGTGQYRNVPILARGYFPKRDIQIIYFPDRCV